jgi:predicted Zn-dependent peptidase
LTLQSLASLDDEPQQKVFIELRRRHYPEPFNRSHLGRKADIESLKLADAQAHWRRGVVPDGSVIGFAGKFDWDSLREQVGHLTREWKGTLAEPLPGQPGPRGHTHQTAPSTQVHIGLAYDAPPETSDESILQRAAAAVLSGGMSGRLFTQVREKRGLCYSVHAGYAGQKTRGTMLAYAGTTAPRAQETLDVLTAELRRLSEGIEPAEFERAIVGMKSRLVMQGESTSARAHAIAVDQYLFGRPRTLDELIRRVDGVTLERLNQFVRAHPFPSREAGPAATTLVTIGPTALQPA